MSLGFSLILIAAFAIFLLLRTPIGYALAFASLVTVWAMGSMPLTIIPQRLAAGVNSFPLMAVPLFLLAGTLMNAGGATQRLIRLSMVLVGHVAGGLGHVVVVTNMIMAGMSGSAVADAMGTGSILIPAMKKEGYKADFAAALTAAASLIGPVIPPSIPFVIYGVMAEVNIGDLFIAGFVPGVMMGLSLMIYVAIRAKREHFPRHERADLHELLSALKSGSWALLLPVIILGGIVGGIFTPTEAAGVAAVYALFLGLFVYRELTLKQLPGLFWEAAHTTGTVLFILAAASIFAWLMTVTQVADAAQAFVTATAHDAWVVLLLFNVILLILGCFLDTFAIITIAAPVMVPIVKAYGVDPIHFGVVMTVNLMIGALTPPFGMLLYVMGPLAQISFDRMVKAVVPFIVPIAIVLVIITYVPEFTLAFPRLLHGIFGR
ncbi:MAG: TRAP transporter large permease [Chloroflexota bacterium]